MPHDRDLPEDVVVDGKVVQPAGTYDFVNDGKYWTGFDRTNPIEGAAREKVWTGTALALIGELGVGSVTASALTMGFGIAALFALIGLTVVLTGLGLVWATRAADRKGQGAGLQAGGEPRLTTPAGRNGPHTNERRGTSPRRSCFASES
jgi:hypothetical protein